ncbi:TetR/AcrR family transcriptional regulator [Agromyces mariniharenae]|uniref:TetR/AcrR family transcriptional regulator n=1 Tax=Agromyces mariniharenae TaxID=2604423 RepID=A0A5S4UV92_9MICO|nr:TetR/AcrR family transcriptional regulator [Agromyces mariniharenae]TYL50486.1 TetR/AcrR family transcriptional regulator [Agromyces mariniharenae]
MREWIPVSTSPKGRLVLAAAREFGSRPFDDVTVADLARAADVTTGALYHHFDGKLGIYAFVRTDVERRVLDRMEGAAAALPGGSASARIGAAMAVGFDFATRAGFAWMLAEPPIGDEPDAIAGALGELCAPPSAELGAMLAAAWRAAVGAVARGGDPATVREALSRLTAG